MKRYAPLLVIPLLLAAAALAHRGYTSGYWRFNHPPATDYPVRGIDISHHQGEIDWEALKEERLHFVYMKATEGGGFKDTHFQKNWEGARRIGLPRGAYHFFTFCKSGAEQAANFIASVPVDPDALPPAIDFEFAGNCSERPSQAELSRDLQDYIRLIEERYGKRPVIYAAHDFYNAYLGGKIAPYALWIRDVFRKPRISDGKEWAFWQFADNGRLRGIEGNVDLNVFNGTEASFARFEKDQRLSSVSQGN